MAWCLKAEDASWGRRRWMPGLLMFQAQESQDVERGTAREVPLWHYVGETNAGGAGGAAAAARRRRRAANFQKCARF